MATSVIRIPPERKEPICSWPRASIDARANAGRFKRISPSKKLCCSIGNIWDISSAGISRSNANAGAARQLLTLATPLIGVRAKTRSRSLSLSRSSLNSKRPVPAACRKARGTKRLQSISRPEVKLRISTSDTSKSPSALKPSPLKALRRL